MDNKSGGNQKKCLGGEMEVVWAYDAEKSTT